MKGVLLTAMLGLLLALPMGARANAAGPPSPAFFDQWQPQRERPEGRLGAAVSAWRAQITMGELLAQLSQASGVALSASDDVAWMQVTAYVRDRMLLGVMVDLAQLTDGAWYYRRDQLPAEREYVLSARAGALDISDQWMQQRESASIAAWNAEHRAEREDRLEAYAKALELSEEQALALYEASDPWLCGTILDPALRPMISYACGLSGTDREQLLAEGVLEQRVDDLPPGFARHLADWTSGRWGLRMGRREPDPRPDRLDRFSSPEERWTNSVVRLEWTDTSLLLVLRVADGGWFFTDCIALPNHTPVLYREKLVALGLQKETPESTAAMAEEAKAWDRRAGEARQSRIEVQQDPYLPSPDRDSPYIGRRVDLALPGRRTVSIAELLEAVATQLDIDVLADFASDRRPSLDIAAGGASEAELGQWLDRVRARESGGFSWRLRGRYMLCWDLNARLDAMSQLSPADRLTWQSMLRPGASVSLDDMAAELGRLSLLETISLESSFPMLAGLRQRLDRLRIYGRLSDAQRRALRGDGLQFSGLATDQQELLLGAAREGRAWLRPADMAGCVLRLLPRHLASGADGVSLIAEYHFADSPDDRDILFTSPLLIEFPQPRAAQKGIQSNSGREEP